MAYELVFLISGINSCHICTAVSHTGRQVGRATEVLKPWCEYSVTVRLRGDSVCRLRRLICNGNNVPLVAVTVANTVHGKE